jgi:prophage antirepressor-like protein
VPDCDLFGNPIVKTARQPIQLQRLMFEDHRIRVVIKNGEAWWLLDDVAAPLGYTRSRDAARMLADDEKGAHIVPTPGGDQSKLIVSEPGLYRLIINSRRDEAEPFRRWVFHEVLPSIRKTGRYELPRHKQVQRRLKCDEATAIARTKNVDQNKACHARLRDEGASVREYASLHNAAFRGQFGRTAAELRDVLNIKGTPLDRMGALPLAENTLAKLIAERAVQEGTVPPERHSEFLESIAREMASADLSRIGANCIYGLRDDPGRGLVIDVVRGQLAS